MARSDRERSRINPTDLVEVFKRSAEFSKALPPLNRQAHLQAHRERVILYQSKATLDTVAGTEFYSPFSGQINWVRASLAGAPTSTFQVDLLINGETVFTGGEYLEIVSGAKFCGPKPASVMGIVGTDDASPTPLKVKIQTIAAATGPMLLYIGVMVDG